MTHYLTWQWFLRGFGVCVALLQLYHPNVQTPAFLIFAGGLIGLPSIVSAQSKANERAAENGSKNGHDRTKAT